MPLVDIDDRMLALLDMVASKKGVAEMKRQMAQQLQELGAKATEAQVAFMRDLASRAREPNGNETTLEDTRIRNKSEGIQLFRALQEIGCGDFVVGRRKMKTRFKWDRQGAIPVAKAFFGEPIEIIEESEQGAESNRTGATNPNSYKHKFLLRPDLTIEVMLPLDITKEEANRLADFIRSIPF